MSTRRLRFVSSQGLPLPRRDIIVNPVSSAARKSYAPYCDRYKKNSISKNVIDSVCTSSLPEPDTQEITRTEDNNSGSLKLGRVPSKKLTNIPKKNRIKRKESEGKKTSKTTSYDNMLNQKDNGNNASVIISTETISQKEENLTEFTISNDEISNALDNVSDTSVEICRICHGSHMLSTEYGNLISACECRGTIGKMHVKCLERWLTESGKSRCELCSAHYSTIRVHKYGVLKALAMWFLSQNAKQLIVDLVGIMLMTPLAILAGWLSGKTLSSMMAQEPDDISWPLASTFTLACMTLVCYYCWIVAAVTRYTMGWWTWYRSQYEVHLKTEDEAETALTDYS